MLVRFHSQAIEHQIPTPDIFGDEDDISSTQSSTFPTIKPYQLREMLNNPTSHPYDQIIILDARFSYEYRGGKIISARNITTRAALVSIYQRYLGQNICIIFHCEYSVNRGPTLMRLFRDYDRRQNMNNYPHLSYPNIFLLEGGYKRFYQEFPDCCIGGYVPMNSDVYVQNGELRRCHSTYNQQLVLNQPSRLIRRSTSNSQVALAQSQPATDLIEERSLFDETLAFSGSQ